MNINMGETELLLKAVRFNMQIAKPQSQYWLRLRKIEQRLSNHWSLTWREKDHGPQDIDVVIRKRKKS
jgi:hypothetical protein